MKKIFLFLLLALIALGQLPAQSRAWVMGTNVILRQGATRQSAEVKRFQNLQELTVLKAGDSREKMENGEVCDGWGYPWVNVKEEETGATGWIYGRFLYAEETGGDDNSWEAAMSGKKYTLVLADDFSQGPADEEGLTGCETLTLVGLRAAGDNRTRFINMGSFRHMNESRAYHDEKEHPQCEWLLFSSNDGYGMSVSGFKTVNYEGSPALELTIYYGYQEGTSENVLTLQFTDDGNLEVVDYLKGDVVYPED